MHRVHRIRLRRATKMSTALIVTLCVVAAAVIAFFTYRGVRKHIVAKRVEAQTGVKIKRRTFKEWCAAHMPSKRRLIQVYATLLYNANIKGFISGKIYQSATTKYLCVPGLNCYSCPGAVARVRSAHCKTRLPKALPALRFTLSA